MYVDPLHQVVNLITDCTLGIWDSGESIMSTSTFQLPTMFMWYVRSLFYLYFHISKLPF